MDPAQIPFPAADPNSTLPGPSALASEAQSLEQALSQLDEADRQIIIWRNQQRLTFDEIGRQLGCDNFDACVRWFRAIERLAERLEKP